MKKSKYCFIVCMMVIVMLLTGCISEEERAQAEAWRAQAEKNAVTYIEEKYGFEAQVLDSETQKTESLFSPKFTSRTLVTMEYEGKVFHVLADGEEVHMDEASDNYQKEELLAAFEEEVNSLFGVEPDSLVVCGGNNEYSTTVNGEEFYDMFFREYYDGTNLEEVLMEEFFYCVAEYVGDIDLETVYEKNKTSLFAHEHMRAGFVTYDSREAMELSVINTGEGCDKDVYHNAMYVKEALMVEKNEVTPVKLSIGQCGDFYYLNVGADTSQYSITEEEEMDKADEWNGHGFANAAFVSNWSYRIEGDTEYRLYIYIPTEKYEQISTGEQDEKAVIASKFTSEDGDEAYKIWFSVDEVPGYKVYYTNYAEADNHSFRFMYDAKESE